MKYPGYRQLEHSRTVWLLVIAWAAVITYFSSQPGIPGPPMFGIPHFDKVLHFVAYTAGGFLVFRGLMLSYPQIALRPRILVTLLALAAFAALDEYHQTFVSGRSGADPGDWFADVAGTFAGAMICRYLHD